MVTDPVKEEKGRSELEADERTEPEREVEPSVVALLSGLEEADEKGEEDRAEEEEEETVALEVGTADEEAAGRLFWFRKRANICESVLSARRSPNVRRLPIARRTGLNGERVRVTDGARSVPHAEPDRSAFHSDPGQGLSTL